MKSRLLGDICLNCFGTLDSSRFCFRCRQRSIDQVSSWSHLRPRTILNNQYLVGNVLGQGGFGITYTGWDIFLERKVAIKEYFPMSIALREEDKLTVEPQTNMHTTMFMRYKEMFINEFKLLYKVSSLPGIVKVLDVFQENNTVYMVMEHLNGTSLRNYVLTHAGRISFNHTLMILLPVMESLKVVHQFGLIHRDISPDNIFIENKQFVKLIDFGAATIFTDPEQKPLTQLKEGFAPIEQYTTNIMQGPWTDVYEIAATIYACCTATIPTSSRNRVVADNLLPVSYFGISCSPIQDAALMKGLAVHPQSRYSNIGEFMENLYGPSILVAKRDEFGNEIQGENLFKQ